ncbi:MAG: hypothetical protein Q8P17_02355 [bacterium]|nr:hypothetical protein [bacterium]
MKSLFLGILFILFIGIGGFMYRNAIEYPTRPVACQLDAKVCPDGTSVARTGSDCSFPACPAPNVSLSDIGVAYALPDGFVPTELPDSVSVVAYEKSTDGSLSSESIVIRRYFIDASSTPLDVIKKTAIGGPSGLPVPTTAFSSTVIGTQRFTVVSIERFEAVINTAYYLARNSDVLRFDAIDREVINWMEPNLDVSRLPAHSALLGLLTTLQGE